MPQRWAVAFEGVKISEVYSGLLTFFFLGLGWGISLRSFAEVGQCSRLRHNGCRGF
jgi:hypothetical protein